jgi:hypothetical protein
MGGRVGAKGAIITGKEDFSRAKKIKNLHLREIL